MSVPYRRGVLYQCQNQTPNHMNMHVQISDTAYHQQHQSRDSHSHSYHVAAIFASTVGHFLAFLQAHAAGNSFSPIISVAFVLSLLGYFLAFRAKFRFPGYASQIDILMEVLANSSVASAVSLCLPNSKSLWPLIFIFHLVLLIEPLYPTIIKIFDKHVRPLLPLPPPPPLLPVTVTNHDSSPTSAAMPYQNVTAPATVVDLFCQSPLALGESTQL